MANKPVARPKRKRIGELLIDAEIIDSGQLQEALAVQREEGGKVVEILIKLGHLDESKVAEFLAAQPGVPSIDLTNYQIAEEIVQYVPREFAVTNEVFPIDKLGSLLTLGMAFPLDDATISQLEEMTGLRVKALLCHPEDIRNAIEHYYETPEPAAEAPEAQAKRISAGARVEGVAQLIRQIDALPTLPQTVQQVREASESPDVALKDIAQIVSRDPAISAKLLQLANSAAYGFANQVDNVNLATALLGLRETLMVVTSSAIVDLTEKSERFDHKAFWRHSMRCASIAKGIAAHCGYQKNPGVFTGGLLCDIGRFALSESAPSRYAGIPSGLNEHALRKAEEKAFGIGHPEAGYILASHWQLPAELADAIRHHETPDHAEPCGPLTAIVALAARLTDAEDQGLTITPELLSQKQGALAALGVDAETIVGAIAALEVPG